MKIEAKFARYIDAYNTLTKLKAQGFKDAEIPADPFSLSQNGEIDVPGSNNADTLSNLVLNSGDDTDDFPSPLGAANPMVSGMGGFEEITENHYTIIINTKDNQLETIRKLITDSGGRMV